MADHDEQVLLSSLREHARSVYGMDAESYAAGRPDYPAEVYERLTGRCGLRPGAIVMESGPGTGLVTRHIVGCGGRVVAVEPDQAMAAYLAARFPDRVEVVIDTFEHAELGADRFDLAVAATSFHWVDQAAGIAKLGRIVRPGGWVALWWTIFDDPQREDPFRDELESRLGEKDPGGQRHAGFQMNADARCRDLRQRGGLRDVTPEVFHWDLDMDSSQLQALYGSMINVRRRPADERQRLLAEVGAVAGGYPEGKVRRPFMTILYTARRPSP